MSARLLAAAKVYAFNYLQDDAEEVESCTCGPKQHAEAKELFAAIKEAEAAPLPAEQPSNLVALTDIEIEEVAHMVCRNSGQNINFYTLREQIKAVVKARIVGQQTKGGGK